MHELADGREHGGDGVIVGGELLLDARLELIEPLGQFLVGAQQLAQLHERAHDIKDGPSYMQRYVDWTSDNFIEPGAATGLLLFGVWPKSLAPATGFRRPLLGLTNPLTSVPRAVGVPGAGSAVALTSAAAIGVATMFVGMYDATIATTGLLYAIPGGGSCKKPN